jgi:tryptophan halogenase
MIKKVIVLGGGSAGFMAAAALKVKIPALAVLVIRSKDIGIIGVGEGSTVVLTKFLHEYLRVGWRKFMDVANPSWKLGLRFIWGPRPYFNYPFGAGVEANPSGLPKTSGYYCDPQMEYEDIVSAMMAHDRVFERMPNGDPDFHTGIAYHIENEHYVKYLEGYATAMGVQVVDDTVVEVKQDESGVAGLVMASGKMERGDLYVDSSGFASVLLGRTLGEGFISFKSSLFCDRAVVGGWARADEVIRTYTTCETMNSGWCWQIEHENRVNRGYVYSSDFISDEEAERELRASAPKVGTTRVVKFISGRYRNIWVKNVVAAGNASGFVEPLEATALGVISMQSRLLADTLIDCDAQPSPSHMRAYNEYNGRNWDSIRRFIAIHYKYNTRIDTPFWRECREKTDLAGAERVVEFFRENGPSIMWGKQVLLDSFDSFGLHGYNALLLGMKVPYRMTYEPSEKDWKAWKTWQEKMRQRAMRALSVKESLEIIRRPGWKWAGNQVM